MMIDPNMINLLIKKVRHNFERDVIHPKKILLNIFRLFLVIKIWFDHYVYIYFYITLH